MIAPRRSIQDIHPYTLVIFDVRIPGVANRLHQKRAELQESGEIEALDQNHYVLIVWSSEAQGAAI